MCRERSCPADHRAKQRSYLQPDCGSWALDRHGALTVPVASAARGCAAVARRRSPCRLRCWPPARSKDRTMRSRWSASFVQTHARPTPDPVSEYPLRLTEPILGPVEATHAGRVLVVSAAVADLLRCHERLRCSQRVSMLNVGLNLTGFHAGRGAGVEWSARCCMTERRCSSSRRAAHRLRASPMRAVRVRPLWRLDRLLLTKPCSTGC